MDSPSDTKIDIETTLRRKPARGTRRVFIDRLEVVGSVGIYEHERCYQQRVVVTLTLEVADTYDGQADHIGAVYDYDRAISAIRLTIEDGHTNLLETLAERIAQRCLVDGEVESVIVRIEKPDVIANCASVGIEIQRYQTPKNV